MAGLPAWSRKSRADGLTNWGSVFSMLEPIPPPPTENTDPQLDRKSTRLNSSHEWISYAVFCLKKKNNPKSSMRGADVIECPHHSPAARLAGRHKRTFRLRIGERDSVRREGWQSDAECTCRHPT